MFVSVPGLVSYRVGVAVLIANDVPFFSYKFNKKGDYREFIE